MIKVSVFYPASPDATFDMDYYRTHHVPMVQRLLGTACKGASIDHGVGGGKRGEAPTFAAMGHLLFDSIAEFEKAFAPRAPAILGDVPNYTNIQPVIQISEVKL